MIVRGAEQRRPYDEAFDHVVVGSGAAGATAGWVLARAGHSVAVVEEGPAVESKDFHDRAFASTNQLYRDGGVQLARGRAFIPVLQGRVLGGTTVVNSAIMWRLPEDVWDSWDRERGLGTALALAELHRCWDRIEADLSVAPTPREVWGQNNELMDRAGSALGVTTAPTRRAVVGCRGSARCQGGCPYGAKQSMAETYLPEAERNGAALFVDAPVRSVLVEGDRAVGVRGRFAGGGSFRIRARRSVIVAASAIQTPGLLRRSGVRSVHLGAHFQAHPGVSMVGVFPDDVGLWFGATQGFESAEHRLDGRFKIETVALMPEVLMAVLPGVGSQWVSTIAEAPHMAVWAVDLRAHAEGELRDRRSSTSIRFDPEPRDMANLRRALRYTAELYFAAGSREVLPGIHGLPARLGPDDIELLDSAPDDPRAYSMVLTHLFGTARMSVRPEDGVVGPDFVVHGTRNLHVVDSSIFPTNTGVNPQLSIMGIAMLAAERIADRAA